jgi:hypothetical protein
MDTYKNGKVLRPKALDCHISLNDIGSKQGRCEMTDIEYAVLHMSEQS